MEIYLNDKYNNLKIKTENNIMAIYGENNSGKTTFVNDFISLIQNKKREVFSEREYDEKREIIYIAEEWDLKKELELKKTSILRKIIFKHILETLEEKNIDLTNILKNNEILNLILETMNKYIKFENNNYHLNPKLNFKNDSEILELLFKIAIFDKQNEEIEEKWLSKSEKLNIYINLIIELESKNKIFIFDCPETYLDPVEIKKLSELINNLAKNNLIIITLRNPALTKYLNINVNEFFYLSNSERKIKKFFINKDFLINYYLLSNNNFWKININHIRDFKIKIDEIYNLIEKNDFKKIEKDFMEITLPYLLRNINLKTFEFYGNIDMLTENEKFKFILFLVINEIKFNEIKFTSWLKNYYEEIKI
ncbi:MAG: hypothetical protein HPAVJP_0620 [Candidatus Hepatoplasma vulgare]|nr:MAG: hypothetical protein HPAVJP_0620 [Candidatus Hepatoplasma sp.]